VLALSAAAPATAAAAEPDQEQEGRAAPGAGGGDSVDDPGFDPGGENTVLALETGPVAGAPDSGGEEDGGEGTPVEAEPTDDPEARLVLPDESEPAPQLGPAPQTEPPPEQAPVAPPAVPVPSPAPALQPGVLLDEGAAPRERPRRLRFAHGEKPASDHSAPAPRAESPPAPPTAEAPGAVPAVGGEAVAASLRTPATTPVEGDSYRVRPGDSLWSIARRLLGRAASTGQIAREVNRLWELNRERIGTGDPDLLAIGTVLKLR
jgi:nucleoid-associated protein YgaU